MNRNTLPLIALGVLLFLKFGDFSSPVIPAGPGVKELRSTGLSKTDALKLATYIRAYGDLVQEDGSRQSPYIKTTNVLKTKMRTIGDLMMGTGAALEDAYPGLPEVLGKHIQVEGQGRTGELTQDVRSEFKGKCYELAELLKKV